LLKHFQEVADL